MTNDECQMTNFIYPSFDIRHSEIRHYLFGLNNPPPAILPAIRADNVRRLHRAALRAGLQLLGLQRVVCTTHAGPRVRLFAFRYAHGNTCKLAKYVACGESTSVSRLSTRRQGRQEARSPGPTLVCHQFAEAKEYGEECY